MKSIISSGKPVFEWCLILLQFTFEHKFPMSKVVAWIARITIISSFYIEFVFLNWNQFLYLRSKFEIFDFFQCENEEDKFAVFDGNTT